MVDTTQPSSSNTTNNNVAPTTSPTNTPKLSTTSSIHGPIKPPPPLSNTNNNSNALHPLHHADFELIQEGTPAAEALRANAHVKVTKMGKVARYFHVQALRKNAKWLLGLGSGTKRGKPPRVPDRMERMDGQGGGGDLDVVIENEREEEEEDSSFKDVVVPTNKRFDLEDSERDYAGEILLLGKSSDSSDGDGGSTTRVISFHNDQNDSSKQSSLTLLDTKGKKRKVILGKKSKKKMKKREKKRTNRNYVKGKVIDGQHELYTLSIAMMLGLRYTIFLTNNQLAEDRRNRRMWLDSDEFMKMEKYIFRPDGRDDTPPHQLMHTFKFKDYSPLPFAFLRRMFGINEYEFHHSVCGNANFIEFISNAKSGQFFFYSSDGKYMIKTMTNAESKFLRRILPHYFRHCAQNPNTILTKFLGMYRVKLYHLRKNVKFVIMNSVFDTDKVLSSFYDLKGSVVGRDAKPGESVLKDNDLRRNLEQSAIRLPDKVRQRMREQVRRDCTFLKEMKIMDYSMLVGIHYIPSKDAKKPDISGLVFRGLRKPTQKLERASSDSAVSTVAPPTSPSLFQRCVSGHHQRSHSDIFTVVKSIPGIGGTTSLQDGRKIEFSRSLNDSLNMKEESLDGPINGIPSASPLATTRTPTPLHFQSPLPPNSLPGDDMRVGDLSVTSATSYGYGEEDDYSLLEGPKRPFHLQSPPMTQYYDDEFVKERARIDKRREQAIEQNYWPFHRHYELNGDRRIIPMTAKAMKVECTQCNEEENNMAVAESKCTCFGDPGKYDPDLVAFRENLTLDDFVAPITSRKDGGLMMDLSGVTLPIKVTAGGKTQECDGKIFYMGIIDILQQFNVRKRLEARLRKIQGGEIGASCVHPDVYAERFVNFFDEYTLAQNGPHALDYDSEEEVVFEKSHQPPHLK